VSKEVSIKIDLKELDKQLEEQRERDPDFEAPIDVRSTTFNMGSDPQVGGKRKVIPPALRVVELLKDGVDNPFIKLHWRISRFDVDAGGITSFNVYRRRLSREEVFEEFRDDKKKIRTFSRFGFDRISRKISRKGKFSEEKKAMYQIRRSLIPDNVRNFNLSRLLGSARSSSDFLSRRPTRSRFAPLMDFNPPRVAEGGFERFVLFRKFKKLSNVSYSQFLKKEKQRFVSVKEREFVDVDFNDKEMGYGEVFEYYITSVSDEGKETPRSNIVRVVVEDPAPISPPTNLTVSQLSENNVSLRICLDPRDDVARVILFRKAEDEIFFKRAGSFLNVRDCISLTDLSTLYSKSYTYRVFCENIHGTLSEPKEVELTSTVQKITPQSRSNNLRIPILTVVQDQNSDFIKVTMSSNDPRVAYYELDRRDLTIHERSFHKPSKAFTSFGGIAGRDGWVSNKFFVNRNRDAFASTDEDKGSEYFKRATKEREVIFVDDAVEIEHIYQYRVRGFDLFGNPTPYKLALVKVKGKKAIRSPVNLRTEILRGNPFRIKVLWDDDNLATEFNDEELFQGDPESLREPAKVAYRLQRRRRNEIIYQSFPLTVNQFVVDEVSTSDAVAFSAKRVDVAPTSGSNLDIEGSSQIYVRPFGIPEFLNENDIYYYRVLAVADNGDESNYTEEIEVSTLPELTEIVNFKAEIVASRVRPLRVKISWEFEKDKAAPDRIIIERKYDTTNDTFELVGTEYFNKEFVDRTAEAGNTYIYRAKAIDLLGRESAFFEARLTV
jgi:hypothetical protein